MFCKIFPNLVKVTSGLAVLCSGALPVWLSDALSCWFVSHSAFLRQLGFLSLYSSICLFSTSQPLLIYSSASLTTLAYIVYHHDLIFQILLPILPISDTQTKKADCSRSYFKFDFVIAPWPIYGSDCPLFGASSWSCSHLWFDDSVVQR